MRTRPLGLGSTKVTSGEYAQFEIEITSTASVNGSIRFTLNVLNSIAANILDIPILSTDSIESIVNKVVNNTNNLNGWKKTKKNSTTILFTQEVYGAHTTNFGALRPDSATGISGVLRPINYGRVESSDMYGYYGKYKGIITPNELIALAGITEGTTKNDANNNPNEDITWLKFSHNYKTLFVADRTIHYGVSWNHLDSKGLVFGKVVDIGGQKYLLRLLQGANVNPAIVGGGATSNDEWDSLIVQFTPNTADSHWSNSDVVNSGYGFTMCQETNSSNIGNAISRGSTSITGFSNVNKSSTTLAVGYRPVLEVL